MKSINLFVNWFDHPTRDVEFTECLKRNMRLFDAVTVFKGRPTFTQMFEYCFDRSKDTDINIFANLDIYFDKRVELTKYIKYDEAYCLTRWEDDGKGNVCEFKDRHYGHPGEWSQDAWVFTHGCPTFKADFCMGEPGCDNHLAYLLNQAGYRILNPSLDIRAIHLHNIDRDASHTRPRVGDGKYIPVKITRL